jgi:site-specific DNA-methyltransferase (adenine-specific)
MAARNNPGVVRDAIIAVFQRRKAVMTVAELRDAVAAELGTEVPASSIRSYLNINTPGRFTRTARGRYKLSGRA